MRVIDIQATERMPVRRVLPPHQVTDVEKLKALTAAMRKYGWNGRPLLVVEAGPSFRALTGSHRLAAAEVAGLDEVPVVVVDTDKFFAEYDLSDLWDDEITLSILEEIGDETATALMRAEIELGA